MKWPHTSVHLFSLFQLCFWENSLCEADRSKVSAAVAMEKKPEVWIWAVANLKCSVLQLWTKQRHISWIISLYQHNLQLPTTVSSALKRTSSLVTRFFFFLLSCFLGNCGKLTLQQLWQYSLPVTGADTEAAALGEVIKVFLGVFHVLVDLVHALLHTPQLL